MTTKERLQMLLEAAKAIIKSMDDAEAPERHYAQVARLRQTIAIVEED